MYHPCKNNFKNIKPLRPVPPDKCDNRKEFKLRTSPKFYLNTAKLQPCRIPRRRARRMEISTIKVHVNVNDSQAQGSIRYQCNKGSRYFSEFTSSSIIHATGHPRLFQNDNIPYKLPRDILSIST